MNWLESWRDRRRRRPMGPRYSVIAIWSVIVLAFCALMFVIMEVR